MSFKISILALIAFSLAAACTRHSVGTRSGLLAIRPLHKYQAKDTSVAPDYKDSTAWIVFEDKNMNVDIFFVHPTTYLSPKYWNADLNNEQIIERTKEWSIKRQLSIFTEFGNVYAPQYRQATFYSFVSKSNNANKAMELATKDIKNAWNYYLKNINQSRPIIIAGHSQGSMIIMRLLPEIMSDPKLAKRIIAVYAVGWPLSEKYLKNNPQIKVCEDSTQTGCIISWNTESYSALGTIIDRPSVSVNPLSWTITEEMVSDSFHLGAVFFKDNGSIDTIPNYVDAQNEDGHLMVSPLPNALSLSHQTPIGIYHIIDYNIFYMNTKANVKTRIEAYFNQD